jgi:pectate lyase
MNKISLTLTIVAAGFCLLCASSINAQNLISNGDFSSGLTGWTVATNNTTTYETTITYDSGMGNPSGSALLNRVNTTLADNSDYLYQVIPVSIGKSYQFNADWKGDLLNDDTGRNWAEVMIAFVPDAGAPAFTIQYKKATAGGPNEPTTAWNWESVLASPNSVTSPTNGIFTATDKFMVVGFNLGGRAGTGVGYYNIDNVSVTPFAPVFTNVMRADTNLILQGKNGPANGAYQMLRSPDLTVPITNWPGVGTKAFDLNGNFNFTNAFTADAANFYRLLVVSSEPVSAPAITTQPQDLAIGVGSAANFSVTATGTAPLTYWWYFNTNTFLASDSNATLNIPNAQIVNSGKISVTVSNLVGVTSSVFATLTVTNSATPPLIVTQPTNMLNVVVGQTATFSVTATGTDPLRYQWYNNTNTVLVGQTNTTLVLNNVQLTNAGKYSVTVTNLFGTNNSLFADLTVSTNYSSSGPIGWASVTGYGMTSTTGGGNATPTPATNITHLKSLALDGTPRVILLSGTYITGDVPVEISDNKTLVGVDKYATIQGGINVSAGHSNIIVRNISILGNGQFSTTNSNGVEIQPVDTIAVRTSHHIWFDHLNVADGPDGNCDLTIATDYVTVSWCKFWYTTPTRAHRLSCLIGNGSTSTTDTNKNNVTYHHNWFSTNVDQRMPRLLFGKGHVFNSYYTCTSNGYCVGTGSFASILIENNYFKNVKSPHQFQDTNPSFITATGNIYDNTTGVTNTGLGYPSSNPADNPVAFTNPPYTYPLDAAADVPGIVTVGAGPQ